MCKQSGAKLNQIKLERIERGEKKKKQTKQKGSRSREQLPDLSKSFFLKFFFLLLSFARCFVLLFFFFAVTVARISEGSESERLIGRLTRLFPVHPQLETTRRDERRRRRLSGRRKNLLFLILPSNYFSLYFFL